MSRKNASPAVLIFKGINAILDLVITAFKAETERRRSLPKNSKNKQRTRS